MTTPKVPRRRSDRLTPDEDANHKMGKRTGYSETDGVISLSHTHTEVIDRLIDRIEAERGTSNAILREIQRAASEREARVNREMREWWQMVADDLDLDLKDGWEYVPSIGAIRHRDQGPRTVAAEEDKP